MLQIHLDIDPSNKQGLGLALAIFNAIGQFAVHSGLGTDQPQQGPAPAAAPAAPKPRKPRGGAAAAPQANGPVGDGVQEPELFPHAHPPQQPGAPIASFGQPVPGGMPMAAPQVPDVRVKLRDDLSRFSVTCGPMALQGLLAYFGANKSSELPMDRLEEIYGYMRSSYAQMQQGQNA